MSFDDLNARTLQGGSDEEILQWCFQKGFTPDLEHIEIFNGFMEKLGWRDAAPSGLEEQKAKAGLEGRDDILSLNGR